MGRKAKGVIRVRCLGSGKDHWFLSESRFLRLCPRCERKISGILKGALCRGSEIEDRRVTHNRAPY